ncbi:hypothetical protein [Candidatus Phycosocius spiralis]|uniref:HEPN domain-containing protein n=1 Tax=Candidatus Phycosocius spiralis TaxID=2815099 RepID=A0ABQ4PTG6_9PROT|nr:hypothetical protein [Candidatus Phycosocius spiralis]GIU66293.1 hypothetical protein PsB1_0447 [Candidatus Phycosocius spiralis]
MPYSKDLIKSASRLVGGERGRPKASDCNRAVSTAYYAVFDHLCRSVANRIVPLERDNSMPSETWINVYRSIDHVRVKANFEAISRSSNRNRSDHYSNFALTFITLQNARKEADYLPTKEYGKTEAETLIDQAKRAIYNLDHITKHEVSEIVVGLVVKLSGR